MKTIEKMRNYKYKAVLENGQSITGVMRACGTTQVERQLSLQQAELIYARLDWVGFSFLKQKINSLELLEFCTQMHHIVRAHISLIEGIQLIMCGKNLSKSFHSFLNGIKYQIESGKKLSEALLEHTKNVSPFFVSIVQIGEQKQYLRIHFCLFD